MAKSIMEQLIEENPYKDLGFPGRKEYLDSLAQEYGAEIVYPLADLLGANEDFDGLITALEDYEAGVL